MKLIRPSVVLTLTFVLLTGLAFPLVITLVAQTAFPHQADGSLVKVDGKLVGSELIGQPFAGAKYFHPRPSAAGSGYDAANSSGTNLGPTNPKLIEGAEGFDGVKQLAAKYRETNGVPTGVEIPVDAVTRSGSGLDPHISPRNAALQTPRVARARGIDEAEVAKLVAEATEESWLGIFGDRRVNVLKLNLSLDKGEVGR
jgi:K+-transporting ATPase ATPase C chain